MEKRKKIRLDRTAIINTIGRPELREKIDVRKGRDQRRPAKNWESHQVRLQLIVEGEKKGKKRGRR